MVIIVESYFQGVNLIPLYIPHLLASNDWIYVVFVFCLLSLFKYVSMH